MGGIKRITRYSCLGVGAVLLLVVSLVLRGPHVSNYLKKLILPELELATGQKVIAQKIYVNLFPFFIEAKGMKIFDEEGEKILFASRVKAYIEPTGFLRKDLVIQRLVVKEPEITAGREKIDEIAETFQKYMKTEMTIPLKLDLRAVEVKGGSLQYEDKKHDYSLSAAELGSEVLLGRTQRMKVSAAGLTVRKKGFPDITAKASASLAFGNGTLEIEDLAVDTLGSTLKGSGAYRKDRLDVKTDFSLLAKTVQEMFGLKKADAGRVTGGGKILYAGKTVSVDLKLGGKFYLETLMGLLGVTEKVEGLVDFKGELKGPVHDLQGRARATMTKGNLFSVEIDKVACTVAYGDGVMKFLDGDGRVYNGRARATASIQLPVINSWTLAIDFDDADSVSLFKLMGWDPGIRAGKVKGTLVHAGPGFDPSGWFEYRNDHPDKNILDQIRNMSGRYDVKGHDLYLKALRISTGKSRLMADGLVDLKKETLSFETKFQTDDLHELLSSYTGNLRGKGEFTGRVMGTFSEPVVQGMIAVTEPEYKGYGAETLEARLSYRKDALEVQHVVLKAAAAQLSMQGKISFPEARHLFDFSGPRYALHAVFRDVDLEKAGRTLSDDIRVRGRFGGDLHVGGGGEMPRITGSATLDTFTVYNVSFDSASFGVSYAEKKLRLSGVKIRKGKTHISGDGTLNPDNSFSYRAISDKCYISDLVPVAVQGDAVLSLQSEGSGTFSNPAVTVRGKMIEGTLRGKSVGSGFVEASVKDRDITLKADLLGQKVRISGKGRLEKDIPWNARVEIEPSRYDFLVSSFLKDIPEDFIFSMNGALDLSGDRNHISASALLKNMVLSLYGYTFTNDDEIRISLKDRLLHTDKVSLRSGNTFIRMSGGLTVGKKYDMVISGKSALAPFRSLFSRVGLLRGDGEFEVAVSGEWENPQMNGWLTLQNGSFGLKDYPYRISSVNGRLNMDNDRIVLQQLAGKMGGGDITLTGILYLKKFAFRRFYVEGKIDHVSVAVSNEFNVGFSGGLLYRGTPEEQNVSGDLTIHNARYRERVEWKSWLLKAKKAERIKAEVANLEKATLNIRVAGRNSIYVDNNFARAVMSADMVLRGTIGRPVLSGRLEAKEGTVYFRNNEFSIIHASADFADPHRINPLMEISAETIVKGYKIKMNLEGQMDHFNMSLSSDPPLKEMDILSLLTVGQTGGELKGLEGGIGAGEATSFVTGKIQDVIEERLKTVTGLDRLQIDPYVSRTTGTVEPRVTVSKRLMGEKMFVTYTTSLGTTEEQIIKLEYLLGKNMSLVGVRDERGIIGGDVKFRFQFK